MTRLAIPALFFASLSLAGCAVPASNSTAATTPHGYEEPDTGSLFSGGDRSGISNGVNDAGMTSHQAGAGSAGSGH